MVQSTIEHRWSHRKEVEEAHMYLKCTYTDLSARYTTRHTVLHHTTTTTIRSIVQQTNQRWNGMQVIVKENWNDRCIECLQYTKAICDFYLLLITLHVHNRSKMELIMKKALIRRSNELWNRCIYVNFEWLSVDFVNA